MIRMHILLSAALSMFLLTVIRSDAQTANNAPDAAAVMEAKGVKLMEHSKDLRMTALNAVRNAVAKHQEAREAYLAALKSGTDDEMKLHRDSLDKVEEQIDTATELAEETVLYVVDAQKKLGVVLADLKRASLPEQADEKAAVIRRVTHLLDGAERTLGKAEASVEKLKAAWLIDSAVTPPAEVPDPAAPAGRR
jgi:soluble cytochrome b562